MLQFKWWYLSKCACNATRKLCPQLFRCLSYIFTYSLLTLEGRHYRTRPAYLGIEILQRLDVALMGFKVKGLILFGVLEPQNKSHISAKRNFLSKKYVYVISFQCRRYAFAACKCIPVCIYKHLSKSCAIRTFINLKIAVAIITP